MGLLDAVTGGLQLVGIAQGAGTRKQILGKVLKGINGKLPPLQLPEAYKQLMGQINDQYLQAGQNQKNEITQGFQQSLAHALSQLQMRGLSSSNLTANLTAGNQKKQQEAIANAQTNLLGAQTGAQQQIGLTGLGQVGNERNARIGMQSNLLGQLAGPTVYPQGGSYAGLAQGLQGIGSLAQFLPAMV
jgi:hypothetical protein